MLTFKSKSLSKLETVVEGGFNFSQQCSKMHNCSCTINTFMPLSEGRLVRSADR